MKKLFTAIRKNELEAVREMIAKKPELVHCTAKQPPKKDDGQSPLQVALKTGNFEIAEFLLDSGADVNFMEDESCCNSWRAPVLHDAIRAAVMTCRWNTNNEYMGFRVFSTEERARQSSDVLERMLRAGADVNALDSHGNSGLWAFCLQAAQILPAYNFVEQRESEGRVFTDELKSDLLNVLRLLLEAGADVSYRSPNTKMTAAEFYNYGSPAKLLKAAGVIPEE